MRRVKLQHPAKA